MSQALGDLIRELRALADRIERIEAAKIHADAYTDFGAGLLELCAALAHQCGFSLETFAGLARVAWHSARRPPPSAKPS